MLAAVAWSSAGVLQRQLSVGVATQIAGRAAFAFIALGGYLLASHRQRPRGPQKGTIAVAVAMAVAQACFIVALNFASVAHVLFFQALSPLVAAVVGAKLLDERPGRRTMTAMLIAVGGVGVMVGGPGGGTAKGNALGLVTALAFAVVIVITRHERGSSTVAAICLAQLILVAVFGPFAALARLQAGDVGWLAALGVGQTAVGALFFAAAARSLPAAEMGLVLLLEVALGPLWTWLVVSERPSAATLVGGAIVIVAVALQLGSRSNRPIGDDEMATAR